LIRLLMEQLGGTIALEGHGETTVTMTFPSERPPPVEDSGRPSQSSRVFLCRDVESGNNSDNGDALRPGGLQAFCVRGAA
jgi:hypothetical protein